MQGPGNTYLRRRGCTSLPWFLTLLRTQHRTPGTRRSTPAGRTGPPRSSDLTYAAEAMRNGRAQGGDSGNDSGGDSGNYAHSELPHEYSPAPQSLQKERSSEESFPARHSVHVAVPRSVVKVPAGHHSQAVGHGGPQVPLTVLLLVCLPMGQAEQPPPGAR